jgi:nickel/cobalt exporter
MGWKRPAWTFPHTCSNNVWPQAQGWRLIGTTRAWLVAASLCCAMVVLPVQVAAHPAGFTSVNRYVGLQCDANGVIHIAYLLDFAEMPSYAELDSLDADHDGTLTPAEQRAYLDRRLTPLLGGWTVIVNGERATLRLTGSNLEVREGERGMSTLRVAAEITAERRPPIERDVSDVHVDASDPGFADRPGWREMAGDDSPDAVLTAGNKERPLQALAYGGAATQDPPRVDRAMFTFRRVQTSSPPSPAPAPNWPVVADARLVSLAAAMKRAGGSWTFSAIALALAALLGAGHALSPGHGKALAAAYLVGRRARVSQAVVFGATVTASHTVVVFAIGLLAVVIERTVGSHRVIRGLELASAITVLALGFIQLSTRWRAVASQGHDHSHRHDVIESSEGAHSVLALGAAAGAVPCPSGLAVLFAAIALHRYVLGLALVLAFSSGIALTLTAAGVLVVVARHLLDRAPTSGALARPFAQLGRWLPVVSSACVTSIGVLLCISACSTP